MPGAARSSLVDNEALLEKEIDWLPAGEYEGTAVFTYYTGTAENHGEAMQLELKFPIVLI